MLYLISSLMFMVHIKNRKKEVKREP
jgi:hypothetical protein